MKQREKSRIGLLGILKFFCQAQNYLGLRSNDGILLSHPNFKTLTTLGDRAFVASAPKLWNDLPSDIRMAKSVDTFKKLLKTHLFSKAFYS